MLDDWKLVQINIKVALWPVHWPPSENLLILHGYQQMPANKNFKGVSSSCHFRRNYGEKQWEIHPHNFPIYDILVTFYEDLWHFYDRFNYATLMIELPPCTRTKL